MQKSIEIPSAEENPLRDGVRLLIKSWSNIVLIMTNGLGSQETKHIKELSEFMDCSEYSFGDMDADQIVEVLITELANFIDENEVSEYDVEDFIRIFNFEAMDCLIEQEIDKELNEVVKGVMKLYNTLAKDDRSFYESLVKEKGSYVEKVEEKVKKGKDSKYVKEAITEEPDQFSDDEIDYRAQEEEEKRRKKKKKNKTIKLEDLEDDDMPKPFVIPVDDDDDGWY